MGIGLALVVYLRIVGDGGAVEGVGTTSAAGSEGVGDSGVVWAGEEGLQRAEMKSCVLLWFWPWLFC